MKLQENNKRILNNNSKCDLLNDAFGSHQHRNDMVDDRIMSV